MQSLLNHSSGLPDGAPFFPRAMGDKLWLGYRPGSHWSYSNTGYGLLTLVLERLHGEQIETIIAREVFAPLKLDGAKKRGAAGGPGPLRGRLLAGPDPEPLSARRPS